jgi:hypothetical protein
MASYNGLISGISTTALITGVTTTAINALVPAKHSQEPMFGILTSGLSGSYRFDLVGAVGGCTFIVVTDAVVNANGSQLVGSTNLITGVITCGRPSYCSFTTLEDDSEFKVDVFMAARY